MVPKKPAAPVTSAVDRLCASLSGHGATLGPRSHDSLTRLEWFGPSDSSSRQQRTNFGSVARRAPMGGKVIPATSAMLHAGGLGPAPRQLPEGQRAARRVRDPFV
jgi:hypothetical protein